MLVCNKCLVKTLLSVTDLIWEDSTEHAGVTSLAYGGPDLLQTWGLDFLIQLVKPGMSSLVTYLMAIEQT